MKYSILYNNSHDLPVEFKYPNTPISRAFSIHQIINWLDKGDEIEEIMLMDETLQGFSQAFKLLTWIEGEMRDNSEFNLPKLTLLNIDDHTKELLNNLQQGKLSEEIEELETIEDPDLPEEE